MKILLINQHFYPEVASSGQIMTELCVDLVKESHEVMALTGRPSYRNSEECSTAEYRPGNRSPEEWKSRTGRALTFLHKLLPRRCLELDEAFGVDILRTYTYTPKLRDDNWRYKKRFLQYLSFFISSFFAALLLPRRDVVIYMTTPPLLNGVTACMLRLVKHSACIYNIQDMYPAVAVKLDVVKNKPLIKMCEAVEKVLYRRSDAIVPVGETMAYNIMHKGVDKEKISVIPNWIDPASIRPVRQDNEFLRKHGLEGKFVVMYSGNMGLSQGLEAVIRCADLTRNREDIVYVMIGGGTNRENLKQLAESLSLNNVIFLPYQPKEKLSESLSAASVHLVPLKRGLSDYCVPSKVFGIMASARPMLAAVDEDSETALMVNKARCGKVVPPEDPYSLATAILSLYEEKGNLNNLGENGRSFLLETNTRQVCTKRYMDVIEQVAS